MFRTTGARIENAVFLATKLAQIADVFGFKVCIKYRQQHFCECTWRILFHLDIVIMINYPRPTRDVKNTMHGSQSLCLLLALASLRSQVHYSACAAV